MPQHGTTYVDDLTIKNEAPLWRRVPPHHFVFDDNRGTWRPSSAAFDDHPNGTPMSVVLGEDVAAASRTADSVLAGHEGFGLVSLPAGLARENRQGIVRRPLPDEPAHAEVFGKKTRGVRKALAKGSKWIVPPLAGPASS